MKNLYLILLAICTLFSISANAQELMHYQQPKEFEMPPKLIPSARKYWVSLPKDYEKSTTRYPIVFVFDGNEDYMRNLTLNTVDQMSRFGGMPDCIIVGLMQRNRALDFGPLYAVKNNPSSDKVNGDKFLQFLKTELLPELEKNYRTVNFRVGIGHSLGGLFMTHSFTHDPDFFNGVIAVSPALELDRDSIVFANLKKTLSAKLNRKTYFCWASGSDDVNEIAFKPGSNTLTALFKNTPNKLFAYQYFDLPGKVHSLTPLFSVPQSLEFVFKDWNYQQWVTATANGDVSPDNAIAARTKALKDIYDLAPEDDNMKSILLFRTGFLANSQQKYSKAADYYKASIKYDPKDAGLYWRLAIAYEKLKDYKAAVANLKTSIELLKKDAEMSKYYLEDYEAELKRLEALAAK